MVSDRRMSPNRMSNHRQELRETNWATSLRANLSFRSIWGGALLKSLQDKVNARPYEEKFAEREIDILGWRVESIRSPTPRIIEIKPQKPEFIIYTDASKSTRVVAACVLIPETFARMGSLF